MISGRMKLAASAGLGGDVLVAALHPLVVAVALVLGGLEERVDAEPLAGAVDRRVELQARREHLGAVAELALELLVAGDLLFPLLERRLPLRVGLEEAGEVPRVGGFTFERGGSDLDLFDLFEVDFDLVFVAMASDLTRGPADCQRAAGEISVSGVTFSDIW